MSRPRRDRLRLPSPAQPGVPSVHAFAIDALNGIGYVAETRDVFPTLTVDENLQLGVARDVARKKRNDRPPHFTHDDACALCPVLRERRSATPIC